MSTIKWEKRSHRCHGGGNEPSHSSYSATVHQCVVVWFNFETCFILLANIRWRRRWSESRCRSLSENAYVSRYRNSEGNCSIERLSWCVCDVRGSLNVHAWLQDAETVDWFFSTVCRIHWKRAWIPFCPCFALPTISLLCVRIVITFNFIVHRISMWCVRRTVHCLLLAFALNVDTINACANSNFPSRRSHYNCFYLFCKHPSGSR